MQPSAMRTLYAVSGGRNRLQRLKCCSRSYFPLLVKAFVPAFVAWLIRDFQGLSKHQASVRTFPEEVLDRICTELDTAAYTAYCNEQSVRFFRELFYSSLASSLTV